MHSQKVMYVRGAAKQGPGEARASRSREKSRVRWLVHTPTPFANSVQIVEKQLMIGTTFFLWTAHITLPPTYGKRCIGA
jgi:hypothetical protein